jgi:excisionase family DNA binding protein
MDQGVEKLLYSRRDAAEALSLSVRSVDYLITTGRLTMRRVGGKILIPASAVRRFAREDHPESVRAGNARFSVHVMTRRQSSDTSVNGFGPQSETIDSVPSMSMSNRH